MGVEVTPLGIIWSAIGGMALGLLYFGGLWLTVSRVTLAGSPAILLFGSFLVRTLLAAGGFIWIASGSWVRVLVCLAGFLAGRYVLAKRLGPAALTRSDRSAE